MGTTTINLRLLSNKQSKVHLFKSNAPLRNIINRRESGRN